MKLTTVIACIVLFISSGFLLSSKDNSSLDKQLKTLLNENKFNGKIQEELEKRLGRKLNAKKVSLGKLIFFDKGLGLHQDNSCAGCHAPNFGFGDSQPLAIGINSNDTVGVHRTGTRNQRRTPTVINTAFYPSLMWNGRFTSLKNDPFDNSDGFEFPLPEGEIFNENSAYLKRNKHLLVAQAHIPFTEQPEMAGFTTKAGEGFASFSRFSGLTVNGLEKNADGTNKKGKPMLFNSARKKGISQLAAVCADIDFSVFNDGKGLTVPAVDPAINSSNFRIRDKVLGIINANKEYVRLFGEIYPEVKRGMPIDFVMIGEVVAEFEFSLTFARAPIDEYAMGNTSALTESEKRGAIVFFSNGKCVQCHSTGEDSYQMFSDFKSHNAGVPQIYPVFGAGKGNVPFSELNCPKSSTGTLDFGREEFTGNKQDRYKFRSSPLRNLKLQPFFFHNGSFKSMRDAVTFHLNPSKNISSYSPSKYGVPQDLKYRSADMADVMKTLDPILKPGITLSKNNIDDLVAFLSEGLYDKRLTTQFLKSTVPSAVPTGTKLQVFEFGNVSSNKDAGIVNYFQSEPSQSAIEFSIYPNPVATSLNISTINAVDLTRVEVVDVAGQVRISQKVNASKRITVPVQKLPQGMYFLRLTNTNGNVALRRFIKE